jgi:formate dehydrogenase (coenzyme F420) beta subunit
MIPIERLRAHAKELLEKGAVACVLGFRRGTAGMGAAAPAFVTRPEDVDTLVWDPTCVHNLGRFVRSALRKREGAAKGKPIAIVAKGCDSRTLVVLMQERVFARSDVHIIGVSCERTGVIEPRKLTQHMRGTRVRQVQFTEPDRITVTTGLGEVDVPSQAVLADRCLECRAPAPAVHDVLFGDVEASRTIDPPFGRTTAMSAKPELERWSFWQEQFTRCLRCYACRTVCPMCYCDECVVDSTALAAGSSADDKVNRANWIRRSNTPEDNTVYHLTRAMHLAGRCVDCGECERACPINIPLRLLNTKLEKDAADMFDYRPGTDAGAPALVCSFRDADPDGFIR